MALLLHSLKTIALGSAIAALSMSAHANGGFLFDSGQPPDGIGVDLCNYSGDIYCHQAIAATFNLASAASISSVEAYLGMLSPANVLFELRQGNGDPLGMLEFSRTVSVGTSPAWYGWSGLGEAVNAGTYTLFLLPQVGDLGGAYLGASNLPNSLSATWRSSDDGTSWVQDQELSSYGVRLGGIPTPVPAPLPILGAVAAIGWSRKLRRRIRDAQPA